MLFRRILEHEFKHEFKAPRAAPGFFLGGERDPCFIHCEGKAAKGGGVLMSIMIPHAYTKFSKKNFAPYAKNATVKNIITINKYNVGMKSLDRAMIVSDTLKTETSPVFIS